MTTNKEFDMLLTVFPDYLVEGLIETDLIDIVMDLGRAPLAIYKYGVLELHPKPVTREDLDEVESNLGQINYKNRAGIDGTLHRISVIFNRNKEIIGITARIGRNITKVDDKVEHAALSGNNLLLLGCPGVGKTTMLRTLADKISDTGKKVIVVDTSNEIGGEGDIPHPSIGRARRMQVVHSQYRTMIEAVENHTPEVIIIDEISDNKEANAVRAIAERGIQLIASVHGRSLENLVLNPDLSDLVGGVKSVIIGDIEAKFRGSSKSCLERSRPSSFDVVVEIQSFEKCQVLHNVNYIVDDILNGMGTGGSFQVYEEQATTPAKTRKRKK